MKVTIFLFVTILQKASLQDIGLMKTIPQGTLKGSVMTSRSGRSIYAFWKIPYAKPPVGELRFRPPQPPEEWVGVRDATFDDSTMCPQRNLGLVRVDLFVQRGSENCLYLNVFTPSPHLLKDNHLLPVVVWIHGGSYEFGSYSMYTPNFLLDKDIVMVTINYRLGPFGFMSMEDDLLPGNWGLKDQNMALRWVRDNIKYFGGNPDMVTIFGQSAGGASVHQHMISPLSRGLFHRAISNSGSALCPTALAIPGENRNITIRMAQKLHCPTEPSRELLRCLQKLPMEDILEEQRFLKVWYADPLVIFKPVVESAAPRHEAFLPENPAEAIKFANISHVPWITGLNKADGSLRSAGMFDHPEEVKELSEDFNNIAPISLFYDNRPVNAPVVSRKIRDFYFGTNPINMLSIRPMTNMFTDSWYLAGADQAILLHLSHAKNPVYLYYFIYRGSHSLSANYGNVFIDFGAAHADELLYLFPLGNHFPTVRKYTKADKKEIDILVQIFTDFIIHGNPTPLGNPLGIEWDPVRTDKLEYMHMGKTLRMKNNLLRGRTRFWRELNLY